MRTNLFLGFWGTSMICYLSQFQPKGAQLLPWLVTVAFMAAVSISLATLITWAWHHHQAVKADWLRELDKAQHENPYEHRTDEHGNVWVWRKNYHGKIGGGR